MFCIYCGAELPEGTRFCAECGRRMPASEPEEPVSVQPIQEQAAAPPRYDDLDRIAPCPPAPRRAGAGRIAAGALIGFLVLAVCAAALIRFQPWRLLTGRGETDAAVSAPAVQSVPVQEAVDWTQGNGVWEVGDDLLELSCSGDTLTVLLREGTSTFRGTAAIDGDRAELKLNGKEIVLRLEDRSTLRVSVDGAHQKVSRYEGPMPAVDAPAAVVDGSDSGYLYYASSTGTRSAQGTLPENASLHFWPLDQFAISTADLDRLTREEIDIIRNEAFARHGYVFTTEQWREFFARYTWYTPDPSFTEDRFSKIERQNLDTIVNYARDKGWM